MSPFKEFYRAEIMPALLNQFGYQNAMQIPQLGKITLNIGVGEAIQNPKALEDAVEELTLIAGQRAIITHAKKSVSAFKVREGMAIGCKVTLRRERGCMSSSTVSLMSSSPRFGTFVVYPPMLLMDVGITPSDSPNN